MDARDQALAQLALAMRLVDPNGVNRTMKLAAQFPGRPFDRLLVDCGLLTPDAHRALLQAFEQRARAAQPPQGAAPMWNAPGAPPKRAVVQPMGQPRPTTPPAGVGVRPQQPPPKAPPKRAPSPSDLDEEALLAEPTMVLRDEEPPRAAKRVIVPVDDELPILARPDPDAPLAVPDDEPFDPDGSDVVGGLDEEAILSEPTMIVRDEEPAPKKKAASLSDSAEEALLAEPTMIVRDEDGGAEEEPVLLPPDEDEILAQPTMIVKDEDLTEPTAGAGPDEDDILAQPTMILKDGEKKDSGLHVAIDTSLARDAPSDAKRSGRAPAGPVPGVKSKRGDGPLNREEFQRRLKMRLGFEGFTLGDYKVLGEIARGAFGVVLLVEPGGNTKSIARERGYEGNLALKVMLENKTDPRETQRFLDEVRVLIRFDHPHIVKMFDAGVELGLTYYSMELIKGVEAKTHVMKNGPMPPLLAVRVCKEIASALAYVHSQRTYHRDLKPQNVMLDQSSQPYRSLLIDFGLVTEHLSNDDKGLILGTPSYMPPEQAQPRGGHGDINVTSDIYSLGATLYYLLTGQPPFPGKDPRAIIKAVVADKPKDPCELKPDIPRRIADITLKCLEKKQRDRYHAARLLEADLDAALKSGQMMLKGKSLFGKIFGTEGKKPPPAPKK